MYPLLLKYSHELYKLPPKKFTYTSQKQKASNMFQSIKIKLIAKICRVDKIRKFRRQKKAYNALIDLGNLLPKNLA